MILEGGDTMKHNLEIWENNRVITDVISEDYDVLLDVIRTRIKTTDDIKFLIKVYYEVEE